MDIQDKNNRFILEISSLFIITIILFISPISALGQCVLPGTNVTWLWPVEGSTTMSRGWVTDNELNGHAGIDILRYEGAPIRAAANGIVVRVLHNENQPNYHDAGYGVVIQHADASQHGQNLYSHYAHMMSEPLVSVGDCVQAGQTIGYMGQTGFATGTHLHFSISYANDGYSQRPNNNPIDTTGERYVFNDGINYSRSIIYSHKLDTEKPVISVSRIENKTNSSYEVYLKGSDNMSQKLKFQIATWNGNMSIDDAKWQTSDFVSSKEVPELRSSLRLSNVP